MARINLIAAAVMILVFIIEPFAMESTTEYPPLLSPRTLRIIQNFITQENMTEPQIEVIDPKSGYANSIIFLSSPASSCSLAIKVYSDIQQYHEEIQVLETINSCTELLNTRKQGSYTLPHIVEFKGGVEVDGRGAVLLTKATGQTVADMLYPLTYYGSIREKVNLESVDKVHLSDTFQEMGKQLGTLVGLLFSINPQYLLRHSDSNEGNFIYDESKKQLYMIDITNNLIDMANNPLMIHVECVDQLKPDLLFTFVSGLEREIFGIYPDSVVVGMSLPIGFFSKNDLLTELRALKGDKERANRWRRVLVLHISALKGFYMGCAEGLTNQGIPNHVIDDFNTMFEGNNKLSNCFQDINLALATAGVETIQVPF